MDSREFCRLKNWVALKARRATLVATIFLLPQLSAQNTSDNHQHHTPNPNAKPFGFDHRKLKEISPTRVVKLKNGDKYELKIEKRKQKINGVWIPRMAYNGSIPGPQLEIEQGAEVFITLKNEGDSDTALHSHGIRLDEKFDGVHQNSIKVGESFTYKIKFPDAGVFWYHPHVRSDYTQDSGLYGNYVVRNNGDKNRVYNREIPIILDDLLLDKKGQPEPYDATKITQVAMGRYGNTLLMNGRTDFSLTVSQGEVIRFLLTNASNTRVFQFSIPRIFMKRIASDAGPYEKQTFETSVVIGPSERTIVDAYFPESGEHKIEHLSYMKAPTIGKIVVENKIVSPNLKEKFFNLVEDKNLTNEFDSFVSRASKEPDEVLSIGMSMNLGANMQKHEEEMKKMMQNHRGSADGIEWEDTMPMMNQMMDSTNTLWKFIDTKTKKENNEIKWNFPKDKVIRIRVSNPSDSMHSMQHPFHMHGNRFFVQRVNAISNNENRVWKDTVLIPSGESYDLILDASNPGTWMTHCHISEHHLAGMMFFYKVTQEAK